MSTAVLVETERPGRVMTRCECSGLGFEEIARRLRENGQTLDALQAETGCGRLCTACIPDLHDHLAARR
jgi:NAD(P)H-nitrite reductase large subunit